MVFLILTRRAFDDISSNLIAGATSVWVNPDVLSSDEIARLQARGISVNVLSQAIDAGSPAQLNQALDQIRPTHAGTLWVEHSQPLPKNFQQPVDQTLQSVPGQAPVLTDSHTSLGKTRAVSSWALRQFKRMSASDGVAMIVPYMGFGTAERFVLQGRVIKDRGFTPPSPGRSAWSNLFEFYKRIDSTEVPGARVTARFLDIEQEAVTNMDGYFQLEFSPAQALEHSGWHEVALRLVNPKSSDAETSVRAEVLVPPSTARFGVISDIDDTVLWSNVTNKLSMLKMLAVTNAHTRKPFKGVTAFYCALRDGIGGNEGNPLFYVSSSPWHLYTPLVNFLQTQGIPLGPLMLKELGVKQLFGRGRHHGHKLKNIEKIFQTYPNLPFILIGDSGQQDPEIYREVVARHPNRVRAIYIRNVTPDPARIESLDRLIEEVRTSGAQLLLVPDSESAAAHAAAEGLINPLGMQRVRSDKQDDS